MEPLWWGLCGVVPTDERGWQPPTGGIEILPGWDLATLRGLRVRVGISARLFHVMDLGIMLGT